MAEHSRVAYTAWVAVLRPEGGDFLPWDEVDAAEQRAWAYAAQAVLDAERKPQPHVEPEPPVSEGGEAEAGRIGLRAATIAIERELGFGDIWQTHVEHDEHLARVALEAAEPLIRADEREKIAKLAEDVSAEYRVYDKKGLPCGYSRSFAAFIGEQP